VRPQVQLTISIFSCLSSAMRQAPQAAQNVDSQRADTEHAQIRLLVAGFEQMRERAHKRTLGKVAPVSAAQGGL